MHILLLFQSWLLLLVGRPVFLMRFGAVPYLLRVVHTNLYCLWGLEEDHSVTVSVARSYNRSSNNERGGMFSHMSMKRLFSFYCGGHLKDVSFSFMFQNYTPICISTNKSRCPPWAGG